MSAESFKHCDSSYYHLFSASPMSFKCFPVAGLSLKVGLTFYRNSGIF